MSISEITKYSVKPMKTAAANIHGIERYTAIITVTGYRYFTLIEPCLTSVIIILKFNINNLNRNTGLFDFT